LKKIAIIVAGGLGTRMNAGVPKQFLNLAGKPMLMHCIEAFYAADPGISIVLALPAGYFHAWQQLCEQQAFPIPHQLVAGGETRFHSVQNSLSLTDNEGLIAIHDGARPLVPVSLIRSAFLTAGQLGNCIPVTPVTESLRIVSGTTNRPVHRADFRMVQTPQVFQAAIIKKSLRAGIP